MKIVPIKLSVSLTPYLHNLRFRHSVGHPRIANTHFWMLSKQSYEKQTKIISIHQFGVQPRNELLSEKNIYRKHQNFRHYSTHFTKLGNVSKKKKKEIEIMYVQMLASFF